MKNKKGNDISFNSKNFVFTTGEVKEKCFNQPWTISRKTTTGVVGTVVLTAPNEFEITDVVYDFTKELDVDEYTEIINAVNDCLVHFKFEDVSYIRINTEGINNDMEEALWRLEFVGDPIDRKYMLWECPENRYMALYLCLGVAIGSAIGAATRQSMWMCIGMALGAAVGILLDRMHKKNRDELYAKRIAAASKRK